MLQQRVKKQHKTFAHAQINLTDIVYIYINYLKNIILMYYI